MKYYKCLVRYKSTQNHIYRYFFFDTKSHLFFFDTKSFLFFPHKNISISFLNTKSHKLFSISTQNHIFSFFTQNHVFSFCTQTHIHFSWTGIKKFYIFQLWHCYIKQHLSFSKISKEYVHSSMSFLYENVFFSLHVFS